MDYYSLFYWLTVANNAKTMFIVFISIFTFISFIATVAYFLNSEDDAGQKMSRKWMWWSYPFMIFFWALFVFTPSKKDSLLIVAGGGAMEFLTTDSSAKKIPHEMSTFVLTELKNMAKDAKVELGILSQKDKILEEAKNMTPNELIERIKSDSVFAKIVLNK